MVSNRIKTAVELANAQMLADVILINSPAPSGSSTSTTVTPGRVDRTARMGLPVLRAQATT